MTVKELKERLNELDDNLIVMIPDEYSLTGYTMATHISSGVNEADGCIFLTDYVEDDEIELVKEYNCFGCLYESLDGSTDDISVCVSCNRMNDLAKNDKYIER